MPSPAHHAVLMTGVPYSGHLSLRNNLMCSKTTNIEWVKTCSDSQLPRHRSKNGLHNLGQFRTSGQFRISVNFE